MGIVHERNSWTGDSNRRIGLPVLMTRMRTPAAAVYDDNLGPLLDAEQSEALEAYDRKHSGPGGEPNCPLCGTRMLRKVEAHPAPRGDESPFRVRLVCSGAECRCWTVYDW